jgi:hypothetical protein
MVIKSLEEQMRQQLVSTTRTTIHINSNMVYRRIDSGTDSITTYSSSRSSMVKHSSSSQNTAYIRNKYLHKLGFEPSAISPSMSKIRPSLSEQQQKQPQPLPQLKLKPRSSSFSSKINRGQRQSRTYKMYRSSINDAVHSNSSQSDNYSQERDANSDHSASASSSSYEQCQPNVSVNQQQAPNSPKCISELVPEEEGEEDKSSISENTLDLNSNEKSTSSSTSSSASFDSRSSSNSSSKSTTRQKKQRSVSFDETVTVLTIPNKDAYSDRIRKHLWMEPHEMLQNTNRNTIEFASENWDWRQVADDVEFYICPMTGEKIHPCHTGYIYQQPQQISIHRHPFLRKSREAAMAWQQCGGYM